MILIRFSFLCHLSKLASLQNKMSQSYAKGFILLGIIILVPKQGMSKLPYEVLDSIVELSEFDDFKDLMKVNVSDERGPTRPIYRLDLGPDYVAYYEIDTGKDYVILSSGPRTKDFREVQSGPDPRPTDLLIQQAKKKRSEVWEVLSIVTSGTDNLQQPKWNRCGSKLQLDSWCCRGIFFFIVYVKDSPEKMNLVTKVTAWSLENI